MYGLLELLCNFKLVKVQHQLFLTQDDLYCEHVLSFFSYADVKPPTFAKINSLLFALISLMGGFVEVSKYDSVNKFHSFIFISPWINPMDIGAGCKVDISPMILGK